MNTDLVMSYVRTGLKVAGSVLVTLGVVKPDDVAIVSPAVIDLVGAAMTIAGVIWSHYEHKE